MRRVLVVDDYEPWRRHVVSTLANGSQWEVIAEAADGSHAVEKALALRPDVILLDVGLPTINGVEAAQQILAHDPALRILFVSEHQSSDVAEVALCAGGRGYVCKSDVGTELAPAMDAVAAGRRFVSARLGGRISHVPDGACTWGRRHEIAFYSDDLQHVDRWAALAHTALNQGHVFVVVEREPMMRSLRDALQHRGVHLQEAERDGRFITLDVAEVLCRFMVNDWPDDARFWNTVVSLVLGARRGAQGHGRVIACGVCALHLYTSASADAAIRLEELWNEATRTFELDIWCAYPENAKQQERCFDRVRALHTAVYPH